MYPVSTTVFKTIISTWMLGRTGTCRLSQQWWQVAVGWVPVEHSPANQWWNGWPTFQKESKKGDSVQLGLGTQAVWKSRTINSTKYIDSLLGTITYPLPTMARLSWMMFRTCPGGICLFYQEPLTVDLSRRSGIDSNGTLKHNAIAIQYDDIISAFQDTGTQGITN